MPAAQVVCSVNCLSPSSSVFSKSRGLDDRYSEVRIVFFDIVRFFLGRHPLPYLACNRILGELVVAHTTYVSKVSNSLRFFLMSSLCLLSLLVTPQIPPSTAISNTVSFRLCSSFDVHVTALYTRIELKCGITRLYSFFAYVSSLPRLFPDSPPLCRLQVRFFSQRPCHISAETVPPKLSTCFRFHPLT